MMLLTIRYTHNFGSAEFVVSDKVAEDFFVAMQACAENPWLKDWFEIVDESEPLLPIELPEGRRDTRWQRGVPGSKARIRLRALCHARVSPWEPDSLG